MRSIGFTLICWVILVSCHEKLPQSGYIGENYRSAPQNFYIISPLDASPKSGVNFSTGGKVNLQAEFSHSISYFVKMKGLNSNASFSISGIGQKIEGNNSIWDGSHDGIQFFRAGEKVAIELSFLGSPIISRDTIIIQRTKVYGIFLSDFETTSPAWNTFEPIGPGTETEINRQETGIPTIQGQGYYRIKGFDLNANYYINGVGYTTGKILAPNTNADDVFFNLFVYGNGVTSTKLSIDFAEDDNSDNVFGNTGAPSYKAEEDQLTWQIPVTWKGWKLISIRYSQIPFSKDLPGGAGLGMKGNNKREPHKLHQMGFVLLTDPAKSAGDLIFDYPTFTIGKPLQLKDEQ
ncbi:MAG: hypothetical protein ACK40G_03115 [Cytophagaceae bacterium]